MSDEDYDSDDYCSQCEEHLDDCNCGSEDTEGYSNDFTSDFPWDTGFLTDDERARCVMNESWEGLWEIDESIDPCQAAADFYLLYGMANNSFVDHSHVTFPTSEELVAAGRVLKLSSDVVQVRIKEIEKEKEYNPVVLLSSLSEKANDQFVELVERLDKSFRNYVHLACGGELRHHTTIGGSMFYHGSRRAAWTKWFYIYREYGNDALLEMSKLFREMLGGSVGGERWAVGSDILHGRETLTLGPDEFTSKQLFVDRVFTLEHNGGCFLNKLSWSCNREYPYDDHFGYMKGNVLEAHAADPTDIDTLYNYSSKAVQELLLEYLNLAVKNNLQVVGKWSKSNEVKPKAKKASKSVPVENAVVSKISADEWALAIKASEEEAEKAKLEYELAEVKAKALLETIMDGYVHKEGTITVGGEKTVYMKGDHMDFPPMKSPGIYYKNDFLYPTYPAKSKSTVEKWKPTYSTNEFSSDYYGNYTFIGAEVNIIDAYVNSWKIPQDKLESHWSVETAGPLGYLPTNITSYNKTCSFEVIVPAVDQPVVCSFSLYEEITKEPMHEISYLLWLIHYNQSKIL